MIHSTTVKTLLAGAQRFEPASAEMHKYINSLSKEDYAALATAFLLGREGWERNYYDTDAYYQFVEEKESEGEAVTQKMLDDKFLPRSKKAEQVQEAYAHELSGAVKFNGEYNHNWLSQKTNLLYATNTGLQMLLGDL